MECTAIKAGNVHPSASFHDLTYQQFVAAAVAIGGRMSRCIHEPLGEVVLQSVKAMMERVGTNTSLGTILLIAPLAVAVNRLEREGKTLAELPVYIRETLSRLDSLDSECIYEAIRLAKPGGLGETHTMDIQQVAPESILLAMKTAAAWDDIALQYATSFELVLEYAKNGNLYSHIFKKKKIEEKEALKYFKQAAEAVHYLHSQHIFHRDIKPENILLDSNYNLKLCDFGWCSEEFEG